MKTQRIEELMAGMKSFSTFADVMRRIFTFKQIGYAGSTVAVAITAVSEGIAANVVSKGGF